MKKFAFAASTVFFASSRADIAFCKSAWVAFQVASVLARAASACSAKSVAALRFASALFVRLISSCWS